MNPSYVRSGDVQWPRRLLAASAGLAAFLLFSAYLDRVKELLGGCVDVAADKAPIAGSRLAGIASTSTESPTKRFARQSFL